MASLPVASMTQDEATSALLKLMFSRVVGSQIGKGVCYSLLATTAGTFTFVAALEDADSRDQPVDRYRVEIDRVTHQPGTPMLVCISEEGLREAILVATGHHLKTWSKFTDGALSVSYIVSVEDDPDVKFVVQLRHHGDVTSMNRLMALISSTTDPLTLPLPAVYPIPGEEQRQKMVGMGRQITQLIQGPMADSVYPSMPHAEKLVFVRNMALAFQAIWELPLPVLQGQQAQLIGELRASRSEDGNGTTLYVGPDRHHSLGGPFTSIREYLRAYIRYSLLELQRQDDIEEFKTQVLERVTDFVEAGMQNIPAIVEEVPVVAVHSDMAPHNVILSPTKPGSIAAVIDWEFVASAPYASLHRIIEILFRKSARNGFGKEYEGADELRDAFWGAIPKWKAWNDTGATKVFMEWFRFGLFMKPEWRPKDLEGEEKEDFWRENVSVVEGILKKYG